ncbi:glycosyltransferase [Microbispora sp. NPDC046973]|uniref:glycosyltransferase n=1 Tax=Microbispora sp. NPDC046973 TaxID=3155022 RepID=UPI0033C2CBE2
MLALPRCWQISSASFSQGWAPATYATTSLSGPAHRGHGQPHPPPLLHGIPARAHERYGLAPDLPLVYVTGGVQGSRQINILIEQILPALLTRAQVLHQCGQGDALLVEVTQPPTWMPGRRAGWGSLLRMISRTTGGVSPLPSRR